VTGRCAVVADHFLDGTTEVDVQIVGLEQLGDHPGGAAHRLGIRTVELDADRALALLEPHFGEHPLDAE
jgi:hypothetical protein